MNWWNNLTASIRQAAKEPELLFRLLFLQILYSLSDERVIREAKTSSQTEKKLPKLPRVKSEEVGAEQAMLAYLAKLGEVVEELLPDHEGAVSGKARHCETNH